MRHFSILAAAVSAASLLFGLVVSINDGRAVRIAGLRLSTAYPGVLILVGFVGVSAILWRSRASVADAVERSARVGAGALAIVVFVAALVWGSTVAGGADSYAYLSEAGLWQQG